MTTVSIAMEFNAISNFTVPAHSEAAHGSGWAVSDIERSAFVRVTYALIATVGLTGNALVVFVLIRIPSLRTRTSSFIIHLAVTDFLTCVWIIPFNLFPGSPMLPDTLLGGLLCRLFVNKFPLWATIHASVYSLVCVHMERFVAVVYPIRYQRVFARAHIVYFMVGCWAIGIVSNSYFWMIYANEGGQCSIQPYAHRALQILVGMYTFSVVYVVPIAFNFVVHKKMISVLEEKAALLNSKEIAMANMEKGGGHVKKTGKRRKEAWQLRAAQELSQTLLIVVVTFAICWAPNQFFYFVYCMGVDLPFNTPVYHMTVIMSLCNSCMNPFIYFFKNKHYRVGLKKAISPICCSERVRSNWGSLRSGPPPTTSTGNASSHGANSAPNVSRVSSDNV